MEIDGGAGRSFVPKRDLPAVGGLLLLAAYFVSISWRKWPDPLIDFGRELYTPWRLSEGAAFNRDVEAIFGPFSQHFNALLFSIFGPGLMVLAAANLAIFAAILVLLYGLFVGAWGRAAGFAACVVFVSVFGFSQLVPIGNYNFATPYAHEATHGFLAVLVLVTLLARWMREPTIAMSFFAGLCLGLTAVLKAEFLFAAGAVSVAAVSGRHRIEGKGKRIAVWVAGAVLPTLLFVLYFLRSGTMSAAFVAATGAWLHVFETAGPVGDAVQSQFLGMDHPRDNLRAEFQGIAAALGVLSLVAGGAWCVERLENLTARIVAAVALLAAVGWCSLSAIAWIEAGRCLPGLALAYAAYTCASRMRRAPGSARETSPGDALRLLLSVLALALVVRMALNGRIYQYGFCQAAIAGMLVPAVLLGEVPGWIRVDSWGRTFLAAGALLLFVPGVAAIAGRSREILELKTAPVGEGRDRFLAFPQELNSEGPLVELVSSPLRRRPDAETLIVLPEGIMINYLARKRSPVAPVVFYSHSTAGGKEAEIVRDLERRPPDWVAVVSRDLTEYGIQRYGEKPGSGRDILEWLNRGYIRAGSIGGDPLDNKQAGAALFRPIAAGK